MCRPYAVKFEQEHCIFNAQNFFSKEMSNKIRLVPSMNVSLFYITLDRLIEF